MLVSFFMLQNIRQIYSYSRVNIHNREAEKVVYHFLNALGEKFRQVLVFIIVVKKVIWWSISKI